MLVGLVGLVLLSCVSAIVIYFKFIRKNKVTPERRHLIDERKIFPADFDFSHAESAAYHLDILKQSKKVHPFNGKIAGQKSGPCNGEVSEPRPGKNKVFPIFFGRRDQSCSDHVGEKQEHDFNLSGSISDGELLLDNDAWESPREGDHQDSLEGGSSDSSLPPIVIAPNGEDDDSGDSYSRRKTLRRKSRRRSGSQGSIGGSARSSSSGQESIIIRVQNDSFDSKSSSSDKSNTSTAVRIRKHSSVRSALNVYIGEPSPSDKDFCK